LTRHDTFTRLACGCEIGVSTAWRYVREAVDLLAATADDLATVMGRIHRLAYPLRLGVVLRMPYMRHSPPAARWIRGRRDGVMPRSVSRQARAHFWAAVPLQS
jgi:hypothetical protein